MARRSRVRPAAQLASLNDIVYCNAQSLTKWNITLPLQNIVHLDCHQSCNCPFLTGCTNRRRACALQRLNERAGLSTVCGKQVGAGIAVPLVVCGFV